MTKTGLEFGNSVIVICLIFEICDLEFLVTLADCRKGGKTIEAPQRAAQNQVLWVRILYWGYSF